MPHVPTIVVALMGGGGGSAEPPNNAWWSWLSHGRKGPMCHLLKVFPVFSFVSLNIEKRELGLSSHHYFADIPIGDYISSAICYARFMMSTIKIL